MSLVRYGDLNGDKYIDDNALLVIYLLTDKKFTSLSSQIDAAMHFGKYRPPGWSHIDTKAFLMTFADQYDIEIDNAHFDPDDIGDQDSLSILRDYQEDSINAEPKDLDEEERNCLVREEGIYFDLKPERQDLDRVQADLSAYVDKFHNEGLTLDDDPWEYITSHRGVAYSRNFYTAGKQIDLIKSKVKEMAETHEMPVRIYYPKELDFAKVERPPAGISWFEALYATKSFLPTHSLLALQENQKIEILSYATHSSRSHHPDDPKPMPQQVYEIDIAESWCVFEDYNPESKTIKICNEEVVLTENEDDTKPSLLMRTLAKEPSKTWHSDEIYDDWGGNYKDVPDDQLYQAARKINNKVDNVTGIDNFLEPGSKKVEINSKYLP